VGEALMVSASAQPLKSKLQTAPGNIQNALCKDQVTKGRFKPMVRTLKNPGEKLIDEKSHCAHGIASFYYTRAAVHTERSRINKKLNFNHYI